MANANALRLRKLTTLAKQLRKKSPNKSWQSAIKEAGKQMRGKTVKKSTPVPRKKAALKKPRKVKSVARRSVAGASDSLASLKGKIRAQLKEQLGDRLVSRELATTKTAKKKLSKNITAIRRDLKNFL